METELKIEVADFAPVRARLKELGATYRGLAEEDNVYFDRDGEVEARHESLRLRQDGRARLTWKGSTRVVGGVTERPEVELTVSSVDAAREIFERLGFTVVDRLAKWRESWRLGDVEVTLDQLAFGTFVELEGPPDALRRAAEQLGLDYRTSIPTSYRLLQRERATVHHQ